MTKRIISPETRAKLSAAGKKRAQAFTPEYQKETRKALPKSVCVSGGKAAYKKLVEKYGPEYAADRAAEWRLENPTSLEAIVMDWLGTTPHKREAKVKFESGSFCYVDFVIGTYAIEVNGEWVHSLRVETDSRKYSNLQAAGYTVIILPECDVVSGKAKAIIDAIKEELF